MKAVFVTDRVIYVLDDDGTLLQRSRAFARKLNYPWAWLCPKQIWDLGLSWVEALYALERLSLRERFRLHIRFRGYVKFDQVIEGVI